MNNILKIAEYIKGNIIIDGVAYRFYNDGHVNGTYQRHPINQGEWKTDGRWELVNCAEGLEFITEPSLFKERMFVSLSMIPESALDKTLKLV